MANPTDNTSTPTGSAPLTNTSGQLQQFVVWSPVPWLARPSAAGWTAYKAAIPHRGKYFVKD